MFNSDGTEYPEWMAGRSRFPGIGRRKHMEDGVLSVCRKVREVAFRIYVIVRKACQRGRTGCALFGKNIISHAVALCNKSVGKWRKE